MKRKQTSSTDNNQPSSISTKKQRGLTSDEDFRKTSEVLHLQQVLRISRSTTNSVQEIVNPDIGYGLITTVKKVGTMTPTLHKIYTAFKTSGNASLLPPCIWAIVNPNCLLYNGISESQKVCNHCVKNPYLISEKEGRSFLVKDYREIFFFKHQINPYGFNISALCTMTTKGSIVQTSETDKKHMYRLYTKLRTYSIMLVKISPTQTCVIMGTKQEADKVRKYYKTKMTPCEAKLEQCKFCKKIKSVDDRCFCEYPPSMINP